MHGPIGMDGSGNVFGLPLPSGQQNKQILCFLGEIRLINVGFAVSGDSVQVQQLTVRILQAVFDVDRCLGWLVCLSMR